MVKPGNLSASLSRWLLVLALAFFSISLQAEESTGSVQSTLSSTTLSGSVDSSWSSPSAVPEPATGVLAGLGVLAVVGLKMRRKHLDSFRALK